MFILCLISDYWFKLPLSEAYTQMMSGYNHFNHLHHTFIWQKFVFFSMQQVRKPIYLLIKLSSFGTHFFKKSVCIPLAVRLWAEYGTWLIYQLPYKSDFVFVKLCVKYFVTV